MVQLLILAATAWGSLLWHGGWWALGSREVWPRAALAGGMLAAGAGAGAGALVVLAPRLVAHQPVQIGMAAVTAACWGSFGVALAAVLPRDSRERNAT